MQIHYLALDVAIEHTEDGHVVRITHSPTGEAAAPFQSPFTPGELERFHRLIAAGEITEAVSESLDGDINTQLKRWGQRLFKALFPGALASIVQSSYHFAYQERARLRIRLQINHAPELAMLPWEYLFDPVRQEFVALSLQSSFVRYTNLMHQIVPFKVEPPLRMLVVNSSPGGYPSFDREQAWFTILDTLDYLALEKKLIIERLNKPTLFDLQRRLREKEYHLLHFIGHGSTNPSTGEGSLIFEDEMGRGRPVHGEHLGALLRDHFPLRLIALTACDVVRTPAANPYVSIAANLVRRGVPAVIATHSSLDGAAAASFAGKFYAMIADFTPVDLAMSETRRALLGEQHDRAWGLSALFTRTADGHLFTPIRPDPQKVAQANENAARNRRLWPILGNRR
jgi:hypothetical protein